MMEKITQVRRRETIVSHCRWCFGMIWRRWLPMNTFLILLLFNFIQFMGGEYWIHFHEGKGEWWVFCIDKLYLLWFLLFSQRSRNVVIKGWKGETPSTLMFHIHSHLLNIFYYILEFFVSKFLIKSLIGES